MPRAELTGLLSDGWDGETELIYHQAAGTSYEHVCPAGERWLVVAMGTYCGAGATIHTYRLKDAAAKTILLSDASAVTSYQFIPTTPILLLPTDIIRLEMAASNAANQWNLWVRKVPV